MRWNDEPRGARWWRGRRLLVPAPATGRAVVLTAFARPDAPPGPMPEPDDAR